MGGRHLVTAVAFLLHFPQADDGADLFRDDRATLAGVIDLDGFLESCGGVVHTRAHRSRSATISRWRHQGRLTEILPGVLVRAGSEGDFDQRLRALSLWAPGAVLCEAAAARVTLWPEHPVEELVLAFEGHRASRHGVTISRRRIPPEYVVGNPPLRATHPVLTAVDLADRDCGALIDDLLRTRRATVAHLERALAVGPYRRGNPTRRRIVTRSRTNPWSQAERGYHDLLDRHHITGWTANLRVVLDGVAYWLDIAFERERVVVEIDGFEHHSSWQAFQDDRRRQNLLACHGWTVIRFTWAMLDDPEYVIETISAALAAAGAPRRPAGHARAG